MIPTARAGLLPCAALLLAGCFPTRPRVAFPDANSALDRMKASYACANGVRGEAKIDHFSPKGRVRGDVFLMAVVPDRVRFDVVAFGTTLYTLTSDGERFQMLDVKEKQFLHGPASACNLARLTQVPVPGHALVALLRGEAPVLVHQPQDATIAWDGHGFYRIAIASTREATEEIHLEVRPSDVDKPWAEQRVRVTDVVVTQRGVELYHADMRNFEHVGTSGPRVDPDGIDPPLPAIGPVCDAELPHSIRMRVANTEEDVVFQYKDASWNPPVVPHAFEQTPPPAARAVFVTCADGKP
jgi:outer membrane lipoprotein-sorting protein